MVVSFGTPYTSCCHVAGDGYLSVLFALAVFFFLNEVLQVFKGKPLPPFKECHASLLGCSNLQS